MNPNRSSKWLPRYQN